MPRLRVTVRGLPTIGDVSTPPPPAREPSGNPGRYQRSPAALIGAMIATLVVVVGFVGFRGLFRQDLDVEPRGLSAQEYAAVLTAAREQLPAVAPPAIPEGWTANSMRFTPQPTPRFHLGMLNEDGRYVGLEQSSAALERMIATYVDDDAVAGDDVEIGGELGGTWQSWSDDGGDVALTREYEGTTVLVVSSGGADAVTAYAATLRAP